MSIIEIPKGYKHEDNAALRPGLVDDPQGFAGNVAKAVPLAAAKIGYDFFALGTDVGNTLTAAAGASEDYKLDIGGSFWEAQEMLGFQESNPTVKGFTELFTFVGTTGASMARLAKAPKFAKLLNSSKLSTRVGGKVAVGAVADVAAASVHSRRSDGSIFELVPPEKRSELMQWFITRDEDSEAEGRLKNILEGVALGGIGEMAFMAIGGALKSMRRGIHEIAEDSTEVMKLTDEVIGNGDGKATDNYLREKSTVGQTMGDNLQLPKYRVRSDRGTHTGTSIYGPSTLKSSVNEKTVREIASTNIGVVEDAQKVLRNTSSTPEQKQLAELFLKINEDDIATRLNPRTSGDSAIRGGIEMAKLTAKEFGLDKAKVPAKSRVQVVQDTLDDLWNGELGIKVKEIAEELAWDEEGVKRQLANVQAMGYDALKTITAARVYRHRRLKITQSIAGEIVADGGDIMKNPKLATLANSFMDLDHYDSTIQGTVGMAGRTLSMQQMDPSNMAKMFNEVAQSRRELRATAKGKTGDKAIEAINEDAPGLFDYLTQMFDDQQAVRLRDWLENLAKTDKISHKDLIGQAKGYDIMDVVQAHYLGSLLASFKTLTGSVLVGGAVQSAWKIGIQPIFEGIINDSMRLIGKGMGGASIKDVPVAIAGTWEATNKMVSTWFGKNRHKQLSDVVFTGKSFREGAEEGLGTMTRRELKTTMKGMAEKFHGEKAYTKATLMQIASTIVTPTMSLQNVFVRGINNIDSFFKGMINETMMRVEARRAWSREGGAATFGVKPDTYSDFAEKFVDLQQKHLAISNMDDAIAQKQAFKELYDGKPPELQDSVIDSINRAVRNAEEATLQQDIGSTAQGWVLKKMREQSSKSTIGRFAYMATFPFTKTPVNALSEVMDHTPLLALTTRRNLNILTEGTADQKLEVVAKMAMGGTLIGTVAYGISAGTITGSFDPQERTAMEATGTKEHSILIDGTYYNYEKLGPIAALISSAADVMRRQNFDDEMSHTNLLAQSLAIASEDTHWSTLGEIIEVIQSDNILKDFTTFTIDRTTNVITPLAATFSSLQDLENKKYRTAVDKEVDGLHSELKQHYVERMQSNPLFRWAAGNELYETEIDATGKDVYKYSDTHAGKLMHLLGLGSLDRSEEPYVHAMLKHRLLPSNLNSNAINGVKISPNQKKEHARAMFYGDLEEARSLNLLVESEGFKELELQNPDAAKEMLQRHLNTTKAVADQMFFEASPELQQKKWNQDMFNLPRAVDGMKADYGSDEYLKELRFFSKSRDASNPVAMKQFLDDLKIRQDNARKRNNERDAK